MEHINLGEHCNNYLDQQVASGNFADYEAVLKSLVEEKIGKEPKMSNDEARRLYILKRVQQAEEDLANGDCIEHYPGLIEDMFEAAVKRQKALGNI